MSSINFRPVDPLAAAAAAASAAASAAEAAASAASAAASAASEAAAAASAVAAAVAASAAAPETESEPEPQPEPEPEPQPQPQQESSEDRRMRLSETLCRILQNRPTLSGHPSAAQLLAEYLTDENYNRRIGIPTATAYISDWAGPRRRRRILISQTHIDRVEAWINQYQNSQNMVNGRPL